MPIDIDPYAELGLASSASIDDVRAAYHRAARRFHPDRNKHPGAAIQFGDINAANDILSDSSARRDYDFKAKNLRAEDDLFFSNRVTISRRSVMTLEESQITYMLAEILPDPEAASRQQKTPVRLNIALVLDRSNSMNGVRLDKVKAAAHQIVDKMSENDVISVISFNDRAEVMVEATTVRDKASIKARISLIVASGSTELYHGMELAVQQVRKFIAPRLVNHIIILTDGDTKGDEEACLKLARTASSEGISVSAMGIGQEWNDVFLDQLASIAGGTVTYINSINSVIRFLDNHIRTLGNTFAERVTISVAPDADIKLESVFKLAPSPQPLPHEENLIQLGGLQYNRPISVLFQFELPPNLNLGFRSVARFVVTGDILTNKTPRHRVINDMSIEVTETFVGEDPPTVILDALGKLTLYRMQENAQKALERGDSHEATKHLEKLATRLFELGEHALAHEAQSEAQQVIHNNNLTDKGRKTLKYHTRSLINDTNSEASNE